MGRPWKARRWAFFNLAHAVLFVRSFRGGLQEGWGCCGRCRRRERRGSVRLLSIAECVAGCGGGGLFILKRHCIPRCLGKPARASEWSQQSLLELFEVLRTSPADLRGFRLFMGMTIGVSERSHRVTPQVDTPEEVSAEFQVPDVAPFCSSTSCCRPLSTCYGPTNQAPQNIALSGNEPESEGVLCASAGQSVTASGHCLEESGVP